MEDVDILGDACHLNISERYKQLIIMGVGTDGDTFIDISLHSNGKMRASGDGFSFNQEQTHAILTAIANFASEYDLLEGGI